MLKTVPKYLSNRFNSLRSYVWNNLFPKDDYLKKLNLYRTAQAKKAFKKRVNEITEEATLALLVFILEKFFSDGTKTAKVAVDVFKELNIDGFSIGGIHYSKRNKYVLMGDDLAKLLTGSLSDDIKEIIKNKSFPYEIIDMYKNFIKEL